MHNLLNGPSATSSSQPTQLLESARLIHTLIDSPSNYEEITELYASSVVLRLTYAKSIKTGKEEFFRRVRVNAHNLERVASPGAYLVDSFPSLMYLPKFLAPFKREAERMHADELDLFRSFLGGAMGEKDTAPCYSRTWADTKDQYDLSFDQAAFVMGQLFEAGSVTTSAAMQSYILALIHYPQWQERIQAEVDTVVGESRMPTFDDVPNLPTVRAAVKESMRWRPVTAGGLPHRLTKDDVYDGFFLPEGTNVHPNQWAIHREPALYPDGETFNPDRWLDPKFPTYKEPLTIYPNLTNFSAFGFGRRICPGIALAERSLNIFAARLAWACHISKKRGVDGEEIEVPSYDYRAGFSTQPNNFPFDLRVRGEGRRRVVREEWEKERAADLLM
jgi:hypothetical protein